MTCRFFFPNHCGFHCVCPELDNPACDCKHVDAARRYEIAYSQAMKNRRSTQI